jgi:predicted nuclease of predicted toxin-antitoxin system
VSARRFLLDANLSPETAAFLRSTFGYDVVDLLTLGLSGLADREIVAMAKRDARIVITFDLDFGKIYHRWERGRFGVIVLRLEDQTVESTNRVLGQFFATLGATTPLERSLVVLDGERVRIASEP